MDRNQMERVRTIALAVFLVIFASMLVFFILFRGSMIKEGISFVFGILRPIFYGLILAYILAPLAQFFENILVALITKINKNTKPKAVRVIHIISVFMAAVLLIFLVYGLVTLLIPQLIDSIENIVRNFPTYVDNVQAWINRTFSDDTFDQQTNEFIESAALRVENYLTTNMMPQLDRLLSSVTSSIFEVLIFLKNILLGIVISIYVLVAKDSLRARITRFLYAAMPTARCNRLLDNLRFVDEKFGGFFIGKIIDSFIIALICYVALSIMSIPYALLVSVVIGVTNIIPVFGPFIGAIPTAFLILCVSPIKALYFVIFILILQQFDGNFLGPRILGNTVGLSGLMVLIAIIIGSGLFGLPGMIFAVPVAAILDAFIQAFILRRIKRKDLPEEIESYRYLDGIDPSTRAVEKVKEPDKDSTLYQRIRKKSKLVKEKEGPIKVYPWDRTIADVTARDEAYRAEQRADRSYRRRPATPIQKPMPPKYAGKADDSPKADKVKKEDEA